MSATHKWLKASPNRQDVFFVNPAKAGPSSAAQFELSLNGKRALEKQKRDLKAIKKTKKNEFNQYQDIRNGSLSQDGYNMKLKADRKKVRAIIHELDLEIAKIALAISLIEISLNKIKNSQEKNRIDFRMLPPHILVAGIFERNDKIKVAEKFMDDVVQKSREEEKNLLDKKGKRKAVSLHQNEVEALLREGGELESQENVEKKSRYSASYSSIFKPAATCRQQAENSTLSIKPGLYIRTNG